MSLLEISLFLGGIGAFLDGIAAAVALIRQRQSSIQVIIATSEDISKFLRDKQSDEFSRIEKVVKNVERNPKASFVDKTIAHSYRLQADKRINEALQKWRDLVNYTEGNDDNLTAQAWFSIGYLYLYREIGEGRLSTNNIAIQLQLGSAEVHINPDVVKEVLSCYSEAIRLKPNYIKAYYNRGKAKMFQNEYASALEGCDEAIRLKSDYAEAYVNRGLAKVNLGNTEGAKTDFQTALELAEQKEEDDLKVRVGRWIQELNDIE